MTLTISLTDLVISVLTILASTALVYLIITLSKVIKTINNINSFFEGNKKEIDETIKNLPKICSNAESITNSIKEKTDILDQYIAKNDEAAPALDLETAISSITQIMSLIGEIKNYIGNRKRKR